MKTLRLLAFVSLFALGTVPAAAEPRVRVEGPSVRLADTVTSAPAELAGVEICKAPPAGGSRVLTRNDVLDKLRSANLEPGNLAVPATVRIETLAERWTPVDVSDRST